MRSHCDIIEKLASQRALEKSEWMSLLTALTDGEKELLHKKAAEVATANFGRGIFVRALLEISSYCRNNCYYCGIRCSNKDAQRYRLTKEQILECCDDGAKLGFNTFVLQGGEDPKQNDEWVADVVRAIRGEYPDKAITLSVGERSREAYALFKEAGADRFLLRHETRNDGHYRELHPVPMSGENRRKCLFTLKEIGFQTGSGMMIGSPGQTVEHRTISAGYGNTFRESSGRQRRGYHSFGLSVASAIPSGAYSCNDCIIHAATQWYGACHSRRSECRNAQHITTRRAQEIFNIQQQKKYRSRVGTTDAAARETTECHRLPYKLCPWRLQTTIDNIYKQY